MPLDYVAALVDAVADDDRDAAVALQDLALDAAQGPPDGLGDGSPDVAARVRAGMSAWIRARMEGGGKCAACDAAQESRREAARLRESGEHHRKEGEVWQGDSGRWFTIKSGRAVPHEAPEGGGGGGKPAKAPAGSGHAIKATADVSARHARNMRKLMGELLRGSYSPEDALQDVEIYADRARAGARAAYAADLRGLEGRVAAKYGPDALKTPEWKDVRHAYRDAAADAEAAVDEAADVVRAYAQSYARNPDQERKVGRDDAELMADALDRLHGHGADAYLGHVGNAIEYFVAAHKPRGAAESAAEDVFSFVTAERQLREAARLRESGEHHGKGEVWQGPSGHWFTITDAGHVAPARAPAGGESDAGPASAPGDHPLASLKDTHGIDLTGLPPDAVEAIRQALAPAPKAKSAPKPPAETPPHLAAAADKVKALAQTANDPAVTREQIDAGLDALGLDRMPLADLQALGKHLSRDPADLKTKAGAIKAIRRIPQDAKELLVKGGG